MTAGVTARAEVCDVSLGLIKVSSLARWIRIKRKVLIEVANNSANYYKPFVTPKGRTIDRPVGLLKTLQRRIEASILKPLVQPGISYGGVPGRSHIDAARPHCGKSRVAKLDIKKFFPSITHHHVYRLFINLKCSPDVAHVLTLILTVNGYVPQGSPASTTLANLLLADYDKNIERAALSVDVSATRFVDDITLSGEPENVRHIIQHAISGIHAMNLRINYSKYEYMKRNEKQETLGLTLNKSPGISKTYRKKVRDMVRRSNRYGSTEQSRQSILGKINYIGRLHPRQAERLKDDLLHR